MDQHDEPQFATIMMAVAQNYSAQVSAPTIGFMFQALSQYHVSHIEAAALQIARTRKYTTMPTVADFVEAIEGSVEDKAMTQALCVWDSIGKVGVYGSASYEDPLTAQIVSEMGWKAICATKEDQRDWFLRNFAGAYKAHRRVDSAKAIAAPGALAGLIGDVTRKLGQGDKGE